MSSWSPSAEGFRAVLRHPALPLAEIAWRWSFGAAACTLLGFGLLEYLNSLPLSDTDLLLLRTRHSFLASPALAHMAQGSGLRAVLAGIVACAALLVLWILFASVGRAVVLAELWACLRERLRSLGPAGQAGADGEKLAQPAKRGQLRSLVGLNFLRAGVTLAACAGCLAAMVLAGVTLQPAVIAVTLLVMCLLVWLAWSWLNWFLSLASVFVVRSGADTFGSLSEAVGLVRERPGSVLAVGAWFGLSHLGLFLLALASAMLVVALLSAMPSAIVAGVAVLLVLVYFACVDVLYVGRLAGYLAILEAPGRPPNPLYGRPPEPGPSSGMVDQDELILSHIDLERCSLPPLDP